MVNAQGYRESSVERYERLVRGFLKFANASHPNISQADDYRNHLLDLRQSPATINNACFATSHLYEMHGEVEVPNTASP